MAWRRGLGLGLPLAALLASGCGVAIRAGRPVEMSTHDALEVSERAAERCVHGMTGPGSPFRAPVPGPVTDPAQLEVLAQLPASVRRTAIAAGLEPALAQLLGAREHSPELLAMRDALAAHVYTLETQLVAMEFEVDCVRALINDRLSDYAEGETDRQLALTIWSLVVAAGTGLAAGVWDLANSQVAHPAAPEGPLLVGIVGAVGTTALGTAVLVPEPRPIVYEHEHNVLRPLVVGVDDELVFPRFVFRLLMLPAADGGPSPRDELIARWDEMLALTIPDDQRALAETILFGDGGVHDPRLLTLHQDLLEELGATLDGLARDIDLLASTVALILAAELPAPDISPVTQSATDAADRTLESAP